MANLSETDPSILAQIRDNRTTGKFLLHILETAIDTAELLQSYRLLVSEHSLRESPRADGSTLRSFSFTHRPGSIDPFYDGNTTQYDPSTNARLFEEEEFSVFNEELKQTPFYEIYRAMPFKIGRMRVNLIPPATVFPMHQDSAPRAHIAFLTNPDCFVSSRSGEMYYVQADGNTYIFDTTQFHTAFNASTQDRLHLTMAIADA